MSDDQRARERQICVECGALIDLLDKTWPIRLPEMNATDREIGAWIGQRKLIETLKLWREEATRGTDGIPSILGSHTAAHRTRMGSDGNGDG